MLNYIEHGAPNGRPTVLIVHGLFGSARNWGVIAKRLSDDHHVVAVDMRNHGQSPWFDSHSYPDMAGDLAEVITHLGAPCHVVGHSMGGKAAMVLALAQPELVASLLVAAIAPASYTHEQSQNIAAMRAVDLSQVTKRSEAAAQLAAVLPDKTLQAFFTQSLDVQARQWRLNLDVLEREMDKIIGFPEVSGAYQGPAFFLSGALSDYVKPEARPLIKTLFPKARFGKIPDAGHWLHADRPRAFEASVRAFVDAVNA